MQDASRDAAARLEAALGVATEVRILTTTGDRQAAWSLEKQGGKGLFTAEEFDAAAIPLGHHVFPGTTAVVR